MHPCANSHCFADYTNVHTSAHACRTRMNVQNLFGIPFNVCIPVLDSQKNCNILQHTVTHCSTVQHSATQCNTLQHTATHCNTLQHTATHCNTPQHTATHCNMGLPNPEHGSPKSGNACMYTRLCIRTYVYHSYVRTFIQSRGCVNIYIISSLILLLDEQHT